MRRRSGQRSAEFNGYLRTSPSEEPEAHGGEDCADEEPGASLSGRLTAVAPVTTGSSCEENDCEDAEDVFGGHAMPSHAGEEPLLAPRRRAGVEERRAGFEETQVVGGENALALVPDVPVEVHWRPFFLNSWVPREGISRDEYLTAKFGSAYQALLKKTRRWF